MSTERDLTGQRFGRILVLCPQEEGFSRCRCDCGREVMLRNTLLTSGYMTSCGCARGDCRKKDITGVRSGQAVALEPSQVRRNGAVLWRCRCDCGEEFLAEAYKITGGILKSCGCVRRPAQYALEGQRFGRLTVLEGQRGKLGGTALWRCRCDCGRETLVPTNALIRGSTKSCGCARQEALRRRAIDITGQRFGRLVALEPLEERMGSSVVWRCQCDCGAVTEVSYNRLAQGNTKSCGCLSRECGAPAAHLNYVEGTCVEMLERRAPRKNNTSGYTGVVSYRGRWRSQITFKRKTYNLGTYARLEDAVKARKAAEEKYFGNFLEWYYQTYPEKAPDQTGDKRPGEPETAG